MKKQKDPSWSISPRKRSSKDNAHFSFSAVVHILMQTIKGRGSMRMTLREKNPELAKLLAFAAQMGYAAAEDYFRNIRSANGEDKMNYAIFRAKEYLSNLGSKIPDEDVIKDAITQYGVTNYKFSWAKPTHPLSDFLQIEEEDDEPGDADHLCVGADRDCDHADRDAIRERPAGSDQADAEDQNRQ